MKTIYEYLVNNHLDNINEEITIENICDIFNGDITHSSLIESCSLVEGKFEYIGKRVAHLSPEYLSSEGIFLIIYSRYNNTLDPDYIIKLWHGDPNSAVEELKLFINNVNTKNFIKPTETCYIDCGQLVFNKNLNKFKVFNKNEYLNLKIDKRFK